MRINSEITSDTTGRTKWNLSTHEYLLLAPVNLWGNHFYFQPMPKLRHASPLATHLECASLLGCHFTKAVATSLWVLDFRENLCSNAHSEHSQALVHSLCYKYSCQNKHAQQSRSLGSCQPPDLWVCVLTRG